MPQKRKNKREKEKNRRKINQAREKMLRRPKYTKK